MTASSKPSKQSQQAPPKNLLLEMLEEKKQIMQAVRAGKPASSVRAQRASRKHG